MSDAWDTLVAVSAAGDAWERLTTVSGGDTADCNPGITLSEIKFSLPQEVVRANVLEVLPALKIHQEDLRLTVVNGTITASVQG